MITFFDWTFYYPDHFRTYSDLEEKRIAFLTAGDDEIHLTLEVIDNQLVFHPRWNVNVIVLGDKEFRITTND